MQELTFVYYAVLLLDKITLDVNTTHFYPSLSHSYKQALSHAFVISVTSSSFQHMPKSAGI